MFNNKFTLSLIRHGESVVNANSDLLGQDANVPLSEKGQKQAWLLGERLAAEKNNFDLVFASTYTRAHETAKIAMSHFHNSPDIVLANELREYSAGDWIGGSRSEILTLEVRNRMNNLDHSFLPPNGESLHMVERRASQWLEENILYNKELIEASKNKNLNVAIFCHGMTIKCLLHYVMGFDKGFTWKVTIDNTSISKLSFGNEGWRLHSINDCSHLG